MTTQLLIGTALILITGLGSTAIWATIESLFVRLHPWARQPPHGIKLAAMLGISLIGTVLMMTFSAWVWAMAFRWLDIFPDMEASLYFALVSFTTLGFGDVLLPEEWQLLSGMAAANGLLIFGMLTAMLVEAMREARRQQRG